MDTSKQYIEMCQKADEIQAQIKSRYHDWFVCGECGEIAEADNDYYYTYCPHTSPFIWLPRQDQLQKMVDFVPSQMPVLAEWTVDIRYTGKAYTGTYPEYDKPIFLFDSMEQLWLAFVMREKFEKTWNGSDWIA